MWAIPWIAFADAAFAPRIAGGQSAAPNYSIEWCEGWGAFISAMGARRPKYGKVFANSDYAPTILFHARRCATGFLGRARRHPFGCMA